MLPLVPGLQCNAWQNMSNAGRWSTVRNLEKQLAAQENRQAAEVLPMPQEMRQLDGNGQPQHLGAYDGSKNTIYIEPTLVADSQPYQAVETTFHEGRHAYQHHAVANPGFHDNPQQVEDWRVNSEPNVYYSGDPNEIDPSQQQVDYSLYRWQPVEDDAAKTARERTDELYEGQLENQPGYAEYKANREQEMAWDRQQAEETFGTPEVEEIGRQATYERYDQIEMEQVGQETAQGAGARPEMTPNATSPPQNGIEKRDTEESVQQEASEVLASDHAEGEPSEARQRQTIEPDTLKQHEAPAEPETARTQRETMQQPAGRLPSAAQAPAESTKLDTSIGEAAGESADYDYGYGY